MTTTRVGTGRSRRHPVAAAARGIAAGAVIAGSAAALYAERGMLRSGMAALWHARPGWIAGAIALECMSMAGFVLLQRRLFTAAGARPSFLALTLGLAGVISAVGFAATVAAGAVLTGNPVGAVTGLLAGCGSAVAAAALVIVAHSARGRAPAAARAVRLAQRIARRPAGDPGEIAARAIGRLASLRLGPQAVGYLLACSMVNWVADSLCLAAAIAAAGLPVPWGKLLLVWSAGAGASTLGPTPFGIGVVEVALIAALAAAGTSSPHAVGAVLLYRIITFKLAGLIWVLYMRLRPRGH
jgi:uncharacterized membrane protein YbhN (UPF0104 family)